MLTGGAIEESDPLGLRLPRRPHRLDQHLRRDHRRAPLGDRPRRRPVRLRRADGRRLREDRGEARERLVSGSARFSAEWTSGTTFTVSQRTGVPFVASMATADGSLSPEVRRRHDRRQDVRPRGVRTRVRHAARPSIRRRSWQITINPGTASKLDFVLRRRPSRRGDGARSGRRPDRGRRRADGARDRVRRLDGRDRADAVCRARPGPRHRRHRLVALQRRLRHLRGQRGRGRQHAAARDGSRPRQVELQREHRDRAGRLAPSRRT